MPEILVVALLVLALALAAALAWSFLARTRLIADMAAAESRADQARLALAGVQDDFRAYQAAREAELRDARAKLDETRDALARAREDLGRSETARRAEAEHHAKLCAQLEEQTAKAEQRLKEELQKSEQRIEKIQREADERTARALAEIDRKTREAFESLAGKTLKDTQESFLKLAQESFGKSQEIGAAELDKRRRAFEELVRPIAETLGKTQAQLLQIDERVRLSGELGEQLRAETSRLARALSRPEVRGRYGEIQLRRVAEIAGLTAYCDFCEQLSSADEDGRIQRPDMIVKLPNERQIVVDAKCNIDAYLQAINAETPDEQERHLARFARHVAEQARSLGSKKYWSNYDGSPEFVVMFVPGDHFIDAALSRQPELIEHAAASGVILASPSTLIGLLRAVHVGWREHRLAEEAQALLEAGKELHRRAATAFEHVNKLGAALGSAVGHFNAFVGSTDRMLMPHLRKFEEMEIESKKTLDAPTAIDRTTRTLESAKPSGSTPSPTNPERQRRDTPALPHAAEAPDATTDGELLLTNARTDT